MITISRAHRARSRPERFRDEAFARIDKRAKDAAALQDECLKRLKR